MVDSGKMTTTDSVDGDSVTTVAAALAGEPGVGATVTIQGWVRTRRDSKAGFSFLALSDGSCFDNIQAVADGALPNYESEVLKITSGCSAIVTGELVESPGKGQKFEIKATTIEVVGWVEDPETYPMAPKRHTMEHLRQHAHLRPRTNIISAMTRVRHRLMQAVHRFYDDRGFFWINTPIITASDAEGAGEMFRVSTLDLANPCLATPRTASPITGQDFFGREAYLTVSGQLNVETYCQALMSKVYTFGPDLPGGELPHERGTSPSSGWSSPRWPSPTCRTSPTWRRTS